MAPRAGFGGPAWSHDRRDRRGARHGSAAAPGHTDFRVGGVAVGEQDRVRAQLHERSANDCGGHGTNVASIAAVFGAAERSARDGVPLRHGSGSGGDDRSIEDLQLRRLFPARAASPRSRQPPTRTVPASRTTPWGNADFGRYSPDSREFDFLARDTQPGGTHQPMVEVRGGKRRRWQRRPRERGLGDGRLSRDVKNDGRCL